MSIKKSWTSSAFCSASPIDSVKINKWTKTFFVLFSQLITITDYLFTETYRKSKLRFLWCVDSRVRPVGRPFALFLPCTAGWVVLAVAAGVDALPPLLKLRRSRLRFVLLKFVFAWGCLLKIFDVDLHTSSFDGIELIEIKSVALALLPPFVSAILLQPLPMATPPLQHLLKRLFSLA